MWVNEWFIQFRISIFLGISICSNYHWNWLILQWLYYINGLIVKFQIIFTLEFENFIYCSMFQGWSVIKSLRGAMCKYLGSLKSYQAICICKRITPTIECLHNEFTMLMMLYQLKAYWHYSLLILYQIYRHNKWLRYMHSWDILSNKQQWEMAATFKPTTTE